MANKVIFLLIIQYVLLSCTIECNTSVKNFQLANPRNEPKIGISSSSEKQSEGQSVQINAVVEGLKNSIASGLAAAVVKISLAPFDTIKTIQQRNRQKAEGLSFIRAARYAMKDNRGVMGLYAGVGVAVLGSLPSVGLYFGVYSYSKRLLQKLYENSTASPEKRELLKLLSIAASAAIGNTVASAARVPYEVVKQKLQTGDYSNTFEALQSMISSSNPIQSFFPPSSIQSQIFRDVPYAIVTLLTYEIIRETWVRKANKPSVLRNMMAGASAGGLGSYVTNPMDVIKTRIQIDDDYSGLYDCAAKIFREEGWNGFLKGSQPRLLHKIPANGCFFVAYEFFRRLLRVEQYQQISS